MDIKSQMVMAERRNELDLIEYLVDCEDFSDEIVEYECYGASEEEMS
ncbi:MAG: hypothetical protein GWN30_00655 [Gammaproteobacteria bacterium]|nr:hypothetical protein [Gammaproteobacteria bacterium]NIW98617.1 hypothetical protein [Phycisphaerae bacterium]